MTSIPDLMSLLQFGDSMLPVGAFTFSCGLESATQSGVVRDRDSLAEFLGTALDQAASSDGVALLEAHRAARAGDMGRIRAADHAVFNRKLAGEARVQATRMGRKMAELAEKVLAVPGLVTPWLAGIREGASPGTLPVAQALVFAAMGLDERAAFAAHQYGVASTMLGAASRLMRITHIDTQAVLREASASAEGAYNRVRSTTIAGMGGFAPVTDILAAVHVKSHVRMFMS